MERKKEDKNRKGRMKRRTKTAQERGRQEEQQRTIKSRNEGWKAGELLNGERDGGGKSVDQRGAT